MNYFAVEVREPDHVLTEKILRTAQTLGLKFPKIDVLNRFTLGATKFLRFRVKEDGVTQLLDRLFEDGRAVVGTESGGFVARMRERKGVCSATIMLAVPATSLTYRGPGAQYWERQFQAPD